MLRRRTLTALTVANVSFCTLVFVVFPPRTTDTTDTTDTTGPAAAADGGAAATALVLADFGDGVHFHTSPSHSAGPPHTTAGR